MFDHNRAPSERTNPWGTILLASFIVSALAHYLLFGPFFRWPAFADIGDFAAHWPYIKGYLSKIGFQFQEAGDPATHIRMLGGTVADQVQFWSVIIIREILALAPGIFIAWALYTPGGRDAYRHVDGPQLYEGKMASKHAAMQYKIEVATESNDIYRQGGINLHQDVHLPFRREMQNIFITGQPGSGKSQVALPMVAEMIERGDKLIINDKKREYIEHFYDSSTGVILNPTDRRSPKWNIAADLRHELDIEQHAAQMIPDSNEPIWANGARAVYSGMLVYLLRTRGKKWGWEHLARILEADTDQLANIFREHYPRALSYVDGADETAASFLSNVKAFLGFVFHLADAWPKAYTGNNLVSFRKWAKAKNAKRRILFLSSNPEFPELSAGIAASVFTIIGRSIQSMPDSDRDGKQRITFIFDEFSTIRMRKEDIAEFIADLRSRGARFFLMTQDLAQLVKLLGEDDLDAIKGQVGTWIVLRTSTFSDTARTMSDALGTRVVERPVVTRTGETVSTTWQRDELTLVRAEDIGGLPQAGPAGIHGYIAIAGTNAVYKLQWSLAGLKRSEKGLIPATWIKNGKPREANDEQQRTDLEARHAVTPVEEQQADPTHLIAAEIGEETAQAVMPNTLAADVIGGGMEMASAADLANDLFGDGSNEHEVTNVTHAPVQTKKDKLKKRLKR